MIVPKNDPSINGKAQQFITAIIVNLSTISCGIMCGWPSPIIPQLISKHPPVGEQSFSEDQTSWIISLLAGGGVLTVPFCGMMSERLGRKKFALLSGVPHIATWLLTILAQNHIHLYVARLMSGMAVAMTVFIVPMYIGEIATDDIRGILGSFLLLSINVGTLFAYVAGAFLSYRLFASLSLIFPTLFIVAIFFIPETPAYLVRRDLQSQAYKSLMFFRGNNKVIVEQKLKELRSEMTISDSCCKRVNLRDFFGDRATRRGLIISVGLIAAAPLSGIAVVTNYAETIFELAGSSVSSVTASIIIALVQIVGSQMSTMLMERAGRRLLSLISCLGMAVSLSVVGLFFYLQQHQYNVSSISWLPLLGLSVYIIIFCVGIGPVPFVIISEVFKLEFTSFASTLCYVVYFGFGFITIKTVDIVRQMRGIDECFFLLATFCLGSFIFCYCLLPETKGRSREDIVNELAGIGKSCRNEMPSMDKSTEAKLLMNNASV